MNKYKYGHDFIFMSFLIAITCIYVFGFIGYDMSGILGDIGDARLNNYFLEHGYQYIIGNHSSFWSAPFFYPAQNVMTYSDNHIGTLPLYALYRKIGCDIETSFQFWQLSIFILNSVGAYLAIRLLRFNCIASLVGALFFSLAAPVIIKSAHFQLMPRFIAPFVFYGMIKYIESMRLKYFYIFCASLVYQFYIGIYIGFFLVVFLILIFPFAVFYISKNHNIKKIWDKIYTIKFVGASTVSFAFLYILFRPYIKFKELSGGRSWQEVANMLPRPESWLYTTGSPYSFLNGIGSSLPMQHEHMMFVGLLPIFSVFFALAITIKRNINNNFCQYSICVISSLLVLALIFISTLYIDGFSLYKYLFFRLPGFDAIRGVTRIVLLLLFPLSILISFLVTSILSYKKINLISRGVLLSLLVVVGVYEQYRGGAITYNKLEAQERYVEIAEYLSKFKNYDVFYYQYKKPSDASFVPELDAMFISLVLNAKTINGYSGNQPSGYWPMNTNRYDYWLNEGVLDFDRIKVLKYNPETKIADIDVINKTKNSIKFSSADKPLQDYRFYINLDNIYRDSKLDLIVTNISKVNWPSIYNGMYGVAISHGVANSTGVVKYESRYFLPYDVEPGKSIKVKLNVSGLKKGANKVCFNMVQDGVKWFVNDDKFCTTVIIEK